MAQSGLGMLLRKLREARDLSSRELGQLAGIDHTYEEFPDDHNNTDYRLDVVLPGGRAAVVLSRRDAARQGVDEGLVLGHGRRGPPHCTASTRSVRPRPRRTFPVCYLPRPMSYTVLARKYRPQTFADLVGQEHVTRTLGNAITQGRVAHAFLFTGVRGVGKTTSARILAKALNCEKGPTPEPCNVCDACKEITEGRDLDVLEIDGASNNSVDDVRRLQETLPFRPARDRFKVVIVDEVHMLSTGAFNAFLKTLEEPPPHVKFIFATTEVHKVPVTIRSRCQRYDFRLIPQRLVAERVRHILAQESITADDAVRRGFDRVAIPLIGCGIGGLVWSAVEPVLTAMENPNRIDFQWEVWSL